MSILYSMVRSATVYWEMATSYDCHTPSVYHIILVQSRTLVPCEAYTYIVSHMYTRSYGLHIAAPGRVQIVQVSYYGYCITMA